MIGQTFSHYRIIDKLGQGGMGEVYLAEDSKLDRRVALKFLPPAIEADPEARERLLREAKATSRLNHPNILTVYSVDEHEGRHFIVMEYIPGSHLGEFVRERDLSIDEILRLFIPTVEGLAKAHQEGIIHRDLKPSNLLVDADGRPRILDFGLAKMEGAAKITQTGSTVGTVAYSAPEQLQGKDIDQRADIFSLGVMLYELITRRLPFDGDHEAAVAYAITHEPPEPLARYKNGVPDGLQQIVSKCLSKDVEERYQSCPDLLADLRREQRLLTQSSGVDSDASRVATTSAKRGAWVVGAVVIVALAVLFVFKPWAVNQTANEVSLSSPTLAVLPFDNQGAPEDEYFADGITDEITTQLARIKGLRVISRSSALQYKNSTLSLKQIADQLGVNYILDGTIRWDKSSTTDRVRISPELTHVSDGFRVWGDSYERDLTQIFDIQADIAERIATALGISLLRSQKVQLAQEPTDNLVAYDYYLKAKGKLNLGIQMRDYREAIDLFHRAIEEDPDFTVAYATLAQTHILLYWWYRDPQQLDSARQIFDVILKQDELLPELQLALGTYYTLVEKSYERAKVAFDNAAMALGESSDLYQQTSYLAKREGNWPRALSDAKLALELDPRSAAKCVDLADIYEMLREQDLSQWYLDRAISLKPASATLWLVKARVALRQYGSADSAARVIANAAAFVDPIQAMVDEAGNGWGVLGLWRFGLLDQELDTLSESRLSYLREGPKPYIYHTARAEIARYRGLKDTAQTYYDSAFTLARDLFDRYPDDFHFAQDVAMIAAISGRLDEAIQVGLRAKELMPIEVCHW